MEINYKPLLEQSVLVATSSKYSFYVNEEDQELLVYDGQSVASIDLNALGDQMLNGVKFPVHE